MADSITTAVLIDNGAMAAVPIMERVEVPIVVVEVLLIERLLKFW